MTAGISTAIRYHLAFVLAFVLALVLSLSAGRASAQAVVRNNRIYTVNVESPMAGGSFGIGSWNAVTGSDHPAGGGLDLLYSGSYTGTNFSTLRVYAGAGVTRDYCVLTSPDLDSAFFSEGPSPFGPSGQGWRTVWRLAGENLRVTQDVVVAPSSAFAVWQNSAIYHTVLIENLGASTVRVGWRNLYDWAVSDAFGDDGPRVQLEDACGVVVQPSTPNEFTHSPATAGVMRFTTDEGSPTYQALMALTFDPDRIPALPLTPPDAVAFAGWFDAFDTAFDYTTNGQNVSSDSATLSWWGRTEATARSIPPGGGERFTQIIFAVAFGDCIPPAFNAVESWASYE